VKKTALLFVFTLLLATVSAWAAPSTDTVDWGQLGPSFTLLTTPENWTSTSTAYTGEVGITGSLIGTQNFERLDQGNGWNGNFLPGDHLLWNEGGYQQTGIDIGVLFNQLVNGGGAQIQADYFGAFTATLTAFDSVGNVIGSTVMAGNSTSAGDGSAIFIGFNSGAPNVAFLNFNVVDAFGGDSLAIDTLTIYTPTVPEPGTMLLLGSGLLGAIGYGRRRLGL
jgi:PEP-CTERM motif